MARRFTFHLKKRGDRVTGSETLASMGEALFFGTCLIAGGVALALIIYWMVLPQWRVNQSFVKTTCRVTAPPEVETDSDGSSFRARIPIEYKVDGVLFQSDNYDLRDTWYSKRTEVQEIVNEFQMGKSYPCWYDPADPDTSLLVRGYGLTFWLVLLLPVAFLATGIGGLGYNRWQASTSRERRAAIARRAGDIELFETRQSDQSRYPTVPRDSDLKNSPGTRLAYRLPIATSVGWKLFALTSAAAIWNSLVILFAVVAVRRMMLGRPDWMLTVIILPFAAAGAWLIVYVFRLFLRTTGIGSTRLEISRHPLQPGGSYELFVAQDGNLEIRRFEIWLVCEEQASYRQGTDTVTDTRTVSIHPVFSDANFEVRPGRPYEAECQLQVPPEAMHSFRAASNSVLWKLLVRGNAARWPKYERSFPVVVAPGKE